MGLSLERAVAAVRKHGTIFFDQELNPVLPRQGQWFCELEDSGGALLDGGVVEYRGPSVKMIRLKGQLTSTSTHCVAEEAARIEREPRGILLIRKG